MNASLKYLTWSCRKQAVALISSCLALTMLFAVAGKARAQQLEPRAYSPAPVGVDIFGLTTGYTSGGVVTDPSSPIQNVDAKVYSLAPFYGHTFGLFGRQSSVTVIIPYAWAHVQGDVMDTGRSIDRTGLMDPQVRFAVNLIGGPALTPQEFRQHKPETTLGASLTVVAPYGQYDSSKLINLGTNRWAFKPELGFSQPVGHWALEFYAGVWLFEDNDNFFGGQVKKQDPLATFQTHIVYEVRPHLWFAVDITYYDGGSTTLNGQPQNDRQGNSRGGLTLSVPIKQDQSLKVAWSRGVSTRIGSSFDSIGAAWQMFSF